MTNVTENVFATLSLIFWTVQLLPQVLHNYRRRSTEGQSLLMMFIWWFSCVFLCPYFVYLNLSVALTLQPHGFTLLSMICILQHIWYTGIAKEYADDKLTGDGKAPEDQIMILSTTEDAAEDAGEDLPLSKPLESDAGNHDHDNDHDDDTEFQLKSNQDDRFSLISVHPPIKLRFGPFEYKYNISRRTRTLILTSLAFLAMSMFWINIELLFLYLLRTYPSRGLETSLALIPGLFTAVGFIPQYVVILRSRSAQALSPGFLVMDWLGGVFGVLALVFREGSFEWLAGILYFLVIVCDTGFVVLYVYYEIWLQRKRSAPSLP